MVHSSFRGSLVIASLVLTGGIAAPSRCWGLEQDLVISVYQGPCQDGDFSANLAAARKVVDEALAQKSDFLALPETFLSGYDTAEHVAQGARPLDDPDLQRFIAESATHDMVVMAGLARKTDEGIYNSVLVVHRGKLLGVYDKIMLTSGDKKHFLPGKSIPVFEAHGARFAVVICADTSFLHPALAARLQGAEILFTPHYNRIGQRLMDDHRRWVRNCHVGLACHLRMVVARSNIVSGDARGGLSYGDSLILFPGGEVLTEANLFRTELLTARVTPAMFRMPHAWSDLDQVPPWLRAKLGELLDGQGGRPAESKAASAVR